MRTINLFGVLVLFIIIGFSCKNDTTDYEFSNELLDEYFDVLEGAYVGSTAPVTTDTIEKLQNLEISGSRYITGFETTLKLKPNTIPVNFYIAVRDVKGYFVVPINQQDSLQESYEITLKFVDDIQKDFFFVQIAYEDTSSTANISEYKEIKVMNTTGIFGSLQINLSWNNKNDLDLFVIEPSGDTVYYYNTISENMGFLSKDSYPFCWLTGDGTEQVNYNEESFLEEGEYKVLVGMHNKCEDGPTYYAVNVLFSSDSTVTDTSYLEIPGFSNPFYDTIPDGTESVDPFEIVTFNPASTNKSTGLHLKMIDYGHVAEKKKNTNIRLKY